jgi:uncharacterized membrane protein YhhN
MAMKHALVILYALVGIINIYASSAGHTTLIYISKPALMLILLAHFLKETPRPNNAAKWIMVAALVFSWLGDTFLMFVENPPNIEWFFLLGLAAFLFTHVCYAIYFTKLPAAGPPFLKRQPIWVLPFLAFLVGNTMTLWPGIPAEMKIPVAVYSSVIVLMALFCVNLRGRIPHQAFMSLFVGVMLFVVSDTLIGINKFRHAVPYGQALIMIFYLAGQFFIVRGAINMHPLINKAKD